MRCYAGKRDAMAQGSASGRRELGARAGAQSSASGRRGAARVARRGAVVLLVVGLLAVVLAGLLAAPGASWAQEDENIVNTHQLPDSSFIYETSIAELANADAYMDLQTVLVTGEAVGDIIYESPGSTHCWVTLAASDANDDSTVSVYMSRAAAAGIDTLGEYDTRGTILQVRGTFHLVCTDHQGVSDVHAEAVSVVQEGEPVNHPVDIAVLVGGVVLVALGIGMAMAHRTLRERRR